MATEDNNITTSENEVPERYRQLQLDFAGRKLDSSQETVHYMPESHMRIWYNNVEEDYPLHYHDAAEILFIQEGHYKVAAGKHTLMLKEGDILIVPPYMLHELFHQGKGVRFIAQFDLSGMLMFQDYMMLNPLFMDAYLCNTEHHSAVYDQLKKTLTEIIDTYFDNDVFWEMSIYSKLVEFYSIIGKDYIVNSESMQETEDSVSLNHDVFKKLSLLLHYIDSNYSEDITLDKAAAMTGFSKFYFTRIFKSFTNTSFHNYLMHKRIQAAQSMLSGSIPVTDAAYKSGFKSLATFSRAFRHHTGCSPSEYKNNLKKKNEAYL